jgi:hypothetical protein
MEDIKLSTVAVGTQRRAFRAQSAERDLEDNESTESLALEKEENIDQARTLDFAYRRKWNAFVCFLMIAITLPLFAFRGYAISLQHRAVDVDDLTAWSCFQSISQKVCSSNRPASSAL